jgi:hypothetical protein
MAEAGAKRPARKPAASALLRGGPGASGREQLDSQNRYAILYRLLDAKRPETRERRLDQFVRMLREGKAIYPQGGG